MPQKDLSARVTIGPGSVWSITGSSNERTIANGARRGTTSVCWNRISRPYRCGMLLQTMRPMLPRRVHHRNCSTSGSNHDLHCLSRALHSSFLACFPGWRHLRAPAPESERQILSRVRQSPCKRACPRRYKSGADGLSPVLNLQAALPIVPASPRCAEWQT